MRRGLRTPLAVTTDGAPGLVRAVEAIWPEAERIRCWVHNIRNVLDKVPQEVRPVASALPGGDSGRGGSRAGRRLVAEVVERFGREYPSAMRSLQEDLEASLAHLRLPAAHRKHVRTTNLVERSFEEEPALPQRTGVPEAGLRRAVAGQRTLAAGAIQRARAEAAATLPGGAATTEGNEIKEEPVATVA